MLERINDSKNECMNELKKCRAPHVVDGAPRQVGGRLEVDGQRAVPRGLPRRIVHRGHRVRR